MKDPFFIFEIPATSMSSHEVEVSVDGKRFVAAGVAMRITVSEVTFMDARREALAAKSTSESGLEKLWEEAADYGILPPGWNLMPDKTKRAMTLRLMRDAGEAAGYVPKVR